MAPLIDIHCHLDVFEARGELDALLETARTQGIGTFVTSGTDPRAWNLNATAARRHRDLKLSVGWHPLYLTSWNTGMLEELHSFCRQNEVVLLGEIGLDRSKHSPPRELQEYSLLDQLDLAEALALPVLFHGRNAFGPLLELLEQRGPLRHGGVLHAYSGSPEQLPRFAALGCRFSFSGSSTWPTNLRAQANLAAVPLDRLLLETDAPDMPPASRKGLECRPEDLRETALRVAEHRGLSLSELTAQVQGNVEALLP